MGALPAVAGSASSVVLNACFVWAILSLAARRFPFRMTSGDRMLAVTFSVFAASIVLTGLLAVRHAGLFAATFWLLPFLSPWFLTSRLRAGRDQDYLLIFCLGASVGAIAACFVGFAEFLAGTSRPTAGAGNAAIFGVACLLQGAFSALNITSANPLVRKLAVAGLMAGLLGMLLSGTRGTWIAAVPALCLVFAYAPARWGRLSSARMFILLVAAGLVATLILGDAIWHRLSYASRELTAMSGDGASSLSSIGARLRLWEAALQAIAHSPIWGYGIQNRMLAIQSFYSSFGEGPVGFTHPHNLLLAAFLDGGIIVATALLALLAVPIVIARDGGPDARKRLYFALVLGTIYMVNGMTQIAFKHDVMDSFFISAALMVAVSGRAASGRSSRPDTRFIEQQS